MSNNLTPSKVGDSLKPAYDVHYRNRLSNHEWHRWFSAPVQDLQKCHAWIKSYNKSGTIADIVYISAERNMSTEFRIVECQRKVIEVETVYYK